MEDELFSISLTLCVTTALLIFSKSPASSCSHCITLKSVSAFSEMPVLVTSFYREGLDDGKNIKKKGLETLYLSFIKPREENVLLCGSSNHALTLFVGCLTEPWVSLTSWKITSKRRNKMSNYVLLFCNTNGKLHRHTSLYFYSILFFNLQLYSPGAVSVRRFTYASEQEISEESRW